ncbi:RPN2 family protein [Megaselia abdita]
MKSLGFLAVILAIQVSSIVSLKAASSHLKAEDLARFQKVFVEGLNSNDLQAIYYSSLNIQTTSEAEKTKICNNIVVSHAESKFNDFEKNFYLVGAYKNLQCTNLLPQQALDKIAGSLSKDTSTAQEIFFNVVASKRMNVAIPSAVSDRLSKAVQSIVSKDDSLGTLGYALCVANELGVTIPTLAGKFSEAATMADEVDGKMLQFEGGLGITALVINCGVKALKTNHKLSEVQVLKFATYFLSRRSVQSPKGVHILIESLKTLSELKSVSPISLELIGNGQLAPESLTVTVRASDLLGKPLSPSLTSVFGKITQGAKTVAEKVVFNVKSSDKTTYSADLASLKLARGAYSLELTADSYKQEISFKVLSKVKVQSLEIGVGDSDASSAIKRQTLVYPNKLGDVLKADHSQKVVIKFVLADEQTGKPITVHQAFVRFYNENGNEVVFIAEADSSKTYKFDVDVGQKAGDFNYNSGVYGIEIIVGDSQITNSFQWTIGSLDLKYGADSKTEHASKTRSKLPEIIHQFRQPDKRPPRLVSDVFTALCFAPLVLLFAFWGKLGISLSKSQFTLSAIGFHIGFGSILALFALFWLQLNMFQTIRLLIPIAVFTFLSGNRLLRRIAGQKS